MPTEPIWHDRGTIMGFIPVFEEYTLYPDRLRRTKGLLFKEEDEIFLHRILDIKLERFFFGFGNVVLYSADVTDPVMTLRCIRNAANVRDLLRRTIQAARQESNVEGAEMIGVAYFHNPHLQQPSFVAPDPPKRSRRR